MTEILSAVSPSVFSWSPFGRGSSAAFLLPLPEKDVLWPTPCRTRPKRVAVVALVLTGLVNISRECRTGGPREGTCHPLWSTNAMSQIESGFWISEKQGGSSWMARKQAQTWAQSKTYWATWRIKLQKSNRDLCCASWRKFVLPSWCSSARERWSHKLLRKALFG